MSAEQIHIPEPEEPKAPELGQGILTPIQRQVEKRRALSEQALVNGFLGYAEHAFDLDITRMKAEDSPSAALATHQFLATTVQKRIDTLNPPTQEDKHRRVADTPVGRIIMIPEAPVTRLINEYYQTYGTNRRLKSPVLRSLEEDFFSKAKKPLDANHYEEHYDEVLETYTIMKRERADVFPEIAIGRKLHELLQKRGHILAADSVEVVLAAYGRHFTTIFGERGIVKEKENGEQEVVLEAHAKKHVSMLGRTSVVTQFDIPNDPNIKAENFRRRPPRE